MAEKKTRKARQKCDRGIRSNRTDDFAVVSQRRTEAIGQKGGSRAGSQTHKEVSSRIWRIAARHSADGWARAAKQRYRGAGGVLANDFVPLTE